MVQPGGGVADDRRGRHVGVLPQTRDRVGLLAVDADQRDLLTDGDVVLLPCPLLEQDLAAARKRPPRHVHAVQRLLIPEVGHSLDRQVLLALVAARAPARRAGQPAFDALDVAQRTQRVEGRCGQRQGLYRQIGGVGARVLVRGRLLELVAEDLDRAHAERRDRHGEDDERRAQLARAQVAPGFL